MSANPPAGPEIAARSRSGSPWRLIRALARAFRPLLALPGFCGGLHGWAAESLPSDEAPVLLPPWVLEERIDARLQPARDDSFASTLGPSSVISSSDWRRRTVTTLSEALRAPGVMMQESFGGFEPPRLSIRGSGLDSAPTARGVALLLDGLPFGRADGSFHSGLFEPLLFSRVEVYRGTMHMALTPAVLGGVLNAVSPVVDGAEATTIRFAAGDWGMTRTQVAYRAAHGRVAGVHARADGWREHSQQERYAFAAAVQRAPSPATHLEFATYAATARYDVPGPLTLADAWSRPRSISPAVQRDRPRRDSRVVRVSAQLKASRGDHAVAAGLSFQRLEDDFFQLQANGETEAGSDDVSGHATFARRVGLAGVDHHLLARATFTDGVTRGERFLNERGARGARFAAFDAGADTTALNLEDIVWFTPTLALGTGLTAVYAQRKLEDRPGSTGLARSLTTRDISPRLGATWLAGRHATFSFALSRGIEPPSFDDLMSITGAHPRLTVNSRTLHAQRATTVEIGSRGSIGNFGWSVTAYRGGWRNEILRLADADGQPRGAVNAGPTVHEGVETVLRWTMVGPPHRLSLHATSTLGRFYFDGDPVYGRNRIAGAPPHIGAAELLYDHASGFFAALEPAWSAGCTPVDQAGRLTYGGHTLLHARAGWRPREDIAIVITCRNLFDRAHLASTAGVLDLARSPAATEIFLPGAGRTFSLGVEWKPAGKARTRTQPAQHALNIDP